MVSESSWEDFVIPYEKLSTQTLENCEKGERNKECINEVVHMTVSAVRNIKSYVPCKVSKSIAKKLITKYPKTFKDVDEDGIVISDGSHTVFNKLMDRNNYLNGPHKKRNLVHDLSISSKQRKTILHAKAGCANWQPETEHLPPETLEEKRIFLLNAVHEENFIFDDGIFSLLDETLMHSKDFS